MDKKEFALICILWTFGQEMRAAAGWRENDILNRAEDFDAERAPNGNFIITLYTGPDDDGHRDSAEYHTGRHTWTG